MTFRARITEALQKGKQFVQGNYAGIKVPADAVSSNEAMVISMFGNNIFAYEPETHTFAYDYCGYEGFNKTTSVINCCLAAVGAAYRVKTLHGRIIETKTTDTPTAFGHESKGCRLKA